ncbi:hypothetical protein QBC33DRAFT_519792 [Phialemonium atrogriseum]|uniref:Uncharacterized protein n=1 Tax=Phialemonium atrogriseum TaxID=1093897 RepID=A0AAJ0BPR8_9PEZI|nr:uncharacterized protein QBC33DRAFT_519792 [Phialemonium atrogriseum]KAK1762218.1 hypothetical protein QBC33DRAFT_519792 [Phialemonium atrogriseum]
MRRKIASGILNELMDNVFGRTSVTDYVNLAILQISPNHSLLTTVNGRMMRCKDEFDTLGDGNGRIRASGVVRLSRNRHVHSSLPHPAWAVFALLVLTYHIWISPLVLGFNLTYIITTAVHAVILGASVNSAHDTDVFAVQVDLQFAI